MPASLTAPDVEQFIRDGFIRLEAAFPRPLADECRGLLWAALGLDPVDPSTWRRPVIRIRVGSHLDVPRILRSIGEGGMPFDRVGSHLPQLHDRPLAWATGHAGDVYLCHPFIVHAATWPHRGGLGLG